MRAAALLPAEGNGHSQGGGAALAAAAYSDETPDVKDGATPVPCIYPDKTHDSILPDATAFALRWATAAERGSKLPACPVDGDLPNCSLF